METIEGRMENENGPLSCALIHARARWFQHYRSEGYSERESMLLMEQICYHS